MLKQTSLWGKTIQDCVFLAWNAFQFRQWKKISIVIFNKKNVQETIKHYTCVKIDYTLPTRCAEILKAEIKSQNS